LVDRSYGEVRGNRRKKPKSPVGGARDYREECALINPINLPFGGRKKDIADKAGNGSRERK